MAATSTSSPPPASPSSSPSRWRRLGSSQFLSPPRAGLLLSLPRRILRDPSPSRSTPTWNARPPCLIRRATVSRRTTAVDFVKPLHQFEPKAPGNDASSENPPPAAIVSGEEFVVTVLPKL